MASKCEYLMLPGAFPDKVTPDIGFTEEAIVQWELPIVKVVL